MILELLLANWRAILGVALVAGNFALYSLWQSKDHEFINFKMNIELQVKQAQAEKEAIERRQQLAFNEVKNEYEKKLKDVRSAAVSNFAARMLNTSTAASLLPGTANNPKGTDGSGQKSMVACPDGFIADAAEDALKVQAIQTWVRKNKIPVEGE